MAASFIFHPHVHEAEIVITPDLLIDRVRTVRGNAVRPPAAGDETKQ